MHFQVVALDSKDYIQEYKNFTWNEIPKMLEYIDYHATNGIVQTIKITRWNEKGEKA